MSESQVEIRAVRSEQELHAARAIIAEYIRAVSDVASRSFAHQNVEKELADLPGVYVPPRGNLWLAWKGDEPDPIGCIALRPVVSHLPVERTHTVGEIKRMYTRPTARGLGVARRMCEVLLVEAQRAGYQEIWLDSDPDLVAAQKLYEQMGFVTIERYNQDPDPDTIYLGRVL